jgi:hypothetical protein
VPQGCCNLAGTKREAASERRAQRGHRTNRAPLMRQIDLLSRNRSPMRAEWERHR